jgi:hypothetical protein
MTCVVAIVNSEGKVTIGADSSAVDDIIVTPHREPKVFVKGEFGIGYCHSFRMGQIIEFWFTPPPIPENEKSLMRYMVMDFIPELKSVLEDNGYPNHEDEKTEWSLIVGVRGLIFTIESDWHVGYDDLPYASIGAGSSYALGVLHAAPFWMDSHKAAHVALEAAEKFCPYVVGPFNFIEV